MNKDQETIKESEVCQTCGTTIPSGAPGGLCPKCLLASAGVSAPPEGVEPEQDGEGSARGHAIGDLQKLFPELEIAELLGKGGMGAVYRARQPRLKRDVALKVLTCPPEHHDDFALRFEREAQTLARLNHPNIVTLFDFGERDGLFYFLMEFVEGTDLNQLIKTAELTPEQALRIVPQICDALQYAHDAGITHRDIKPANILISRNGQVRIADFGLAKLIGGEEEPLVSGLTLTGTSMGTPHYMAPEQWEAPEKVDHRADIYSLGVVFYEMLTGERPAGVFKAPSKKSDAVDDRLDTVVLKAMEKEPGQRYQQATEVKDEVTRVTSSPPPTSKTRPSWAPIFTVAALIAVVLVLLAVMDPMGWRRGDVSGEKGAPDDSANTTARTEAEGPALSLPSVTPGRLRAAAKEPEDGYPDLSKLEGIDDLIDVGGRFDEWVVLRANGETISSTEWAELDNIGRIAWSFGTKFALIDREGTIRFLPKNSQLEFRMQDLPPALEGAVIVDVQLGSYHGIALADDGRAFVFGRRYQEPARDFSGNVWPMPPPEILENVKDIATTMNHAAILQDDGTLSVFGQDGLLDLPDNGPASIEAISSSGSTIRLLDGIGQIWNYNAPLGSNPPPKFFHKTKQSGPAVAVKGDCWRAASGRWYSFTEEIDQLLEKNQVAASSPIVAFLGNYGRNFGKPHVHEVLWIEPVEKEAPE